jgi:hypothetical protein
VLLVPVAGCALAFAGLALAEGGVTISLTDDGPQPATATVQIGDMVTFAGTGNQNHAIFGTGFTVPFIRPGESFPVRMVAAGNLKYRATGFYRPSGGIIVVTVPTPPTLKASKASVPVRQSVTLSGTSPLKSYQIALQSKPLGRGVHAAWTQAATLETAADGSFSTVITPETTAAYRVALGRSVSEPVMVGIEPALSLSATPRAAKAGSTVRVVAKVQPASAATLLMLSIYDNTRKPAGWHDIGKASVTAAGTAVFNWKTTPGKARLRVHSTRASAGSGFVSASSPSIVVNVTGSALPKPNQRNPKKPTPKPKPKP